MCLSYVVYEQKLFCPPGYEWLEPGLKGAGNCEHFIIDSFQNLWVVPGCQDFFFLLHWPPRPPTPATRLDLVDDEAVGEVPVPPRCHLGRRSQRRGHRRRGHEKARKAGLPRKRLFFSVLWISDKLTLTLTLGYHFGHRMCKQNFLLLSYYKEIVHCALVFYE